MSTPVHFITPPAPSWRCIGSARVYLEASSYRMTRNYDYNTFEVSRLTLRYYHRTNHEPLNRAYISIPKMAPSRQRQCSQSEIVKDILEEHAKVGGAFTGWLQAKCFIPAPQYNDNIWASPSPLQPLQSALK